MGLPSTDEEWAIRVREMAVVGVGTLESQVPFPTDMAAAYTMEVPTIALSPVMGVSGLQ